MLHTCIIIAITLTVVGLFQLPEFFRKRKLVKNLLFASRELVAPTRWAIYLNGEELRVQPYEDILIITSTKAPHFVTLLKRAHFTVDEWLTIYKVYFAPYDRMRNEVDDEPVMA